MATTTTVAAGQESDEYQCADCMSDFSVVNEPSYRGMTKDQLKESGFSAKTVKHCPFCGGNATES